MPRCGESVPTDALLKRNVPSERFYGAIVTYAPSLQRASTFQQLAHRLRSKSTTARDSGVAMNNGARRRATDANRASDRPYKRTNERARERVSRQRGKDGERKFRAFLPVTGRALIHAAVNLRCRGKAISVAPGRAASGHPAECSDNHLAIPSIIRPSASQ